MLFIIIFGGDMFVNCNYTYLKECFSFGSVLMGDPVVRKVAMCAGALFVLGLGCYVSCTKRSSVSFSKDTARESFALGQMLNHKSWSGKSDVLMDSFRSSYSSYPTGTQDQMKGEDLIATAKRVADILSEMDSELFLELQGIYEKALIEYDDLKGVNPQKLQEIQSEPVIEEIKKVETPKSIPLPALVPVQEQQKYSEFETLKRTVQALRPVKKYLPFRKSSDEKLLYWAIENAKLELSILEKFQKDPYCRVLDCTELNKLVGFAELFLLNSEYGREKTVSSSWRDRSKKTTLDKLYKGELLSRGLEASELKQADGRPFCLSNTSKRGIFKGGSGRRLAVSWSLEETSYYSPAVKRFLEGLMRKDASRQKG